MIASTGVSGVRSSWLNLARNASLARLACSAAIRAVRSASARDWAEMSRMMTSHPGSRPCGKRETRTS